MKKWSPGNHPTRRQKKHAVARTRSCCRDNYAIPPELLLGYTATEREIQGHKIPFFVGPTLDGFAHAVSVEDIQYVLEHMPVDDFKNLGFVLAQPLKKMAKWFPSWGCWVFGTIINTKKYKNVYTHALHAGSSVFIFANDISRPLKWRKSLSNFGKEEFDRLKAAGHKIESDANHYYVTRTLESVRNTQLFTLLHEIGHDVHYWQTMAPYYSDGIYKTEGFKDEDSFYDFLKAVHDVIPHLEKEKFANAYADKLIEKFREQKIFPFPRLTPETFEQFLNKSKNITKSDSNNISNENNNNDNVNNNAEDNTNNPINNSNNISNNNSLDISDNISNNNSNATSKSDSNDNSESTSSNSSSVLE